MISSFATEIISEVNSTQWSQAYGIQDREREVGELDLVLVELQNHIICTNKTQSTATEYIFITWDCEEHPDESYVTIGSISASAYLIDREVWICRSLFLID